MYGVVLAAFLTTGNATPAQDYDALRDIKRSVDDLRKQETESEVEGLKQVINDLRMRLVEERINEVRLAVDEARLGGPWHHGWHLWHEGHTPPVPLPAPATEGGRSRAMILLNVPAGVAIAANGQNMSLPVPTLHPTFVTPPLEPGRDYYYDFKVTAEQDGKAVTRTKRVTVRPGAVVRLSYADMQTP
jgi:uncharacterized protein (TIGR03000 family)